MNFHRMKNRFNREIQGKNERKFKSKLHVKHDITIVTLFGINLHRV